MAPINPDLLVDDENPYPHAADPCSAKWLGPSAASELCPLCFTQRMCLDTWLFRSLSTKSLMYWITWHYPLISTRARGFFEPTGSVINPETSGNHGPRPMSIAIPSGFAVAHGLGQEVIAPSEPSKNGAFGGAGLSEAHSRQQTASVPSLTSHDRWRR